MEPVERITTARLVLRRPTLADVDAVYAYASDPEVTRYMSFPRHTSREDSLRHLESSTRRHDREGTGSYFVELDGAVIGSTGLFLAADERIGTIGYIFARAHWGRGYATEATRPLVELARQKGLSRVESGCHAAHTASMRVLAKCGLTLVRTLPAFKIFPNLGPDPCDFHEYALDL